MTIIKTKDFVLRPFRLADAKLHLETQLDKETQKGFMSTNKILKNATKEIRERLIEEKKGTQKNFVIDVGGKYAGFVSIHNLTKDPYHKHKAEIGYSIHPNYRGRGITTNAVKLVTDYAFKK